MGNFFNSEIIQEELMEINTSKLKERYPDGFDKNKSNARYVNE